MHGVGPQVAGLAALAGLAPLANAYSAGAGLGVMDVVLTIGRPPPQIADVGGRDRGRPLTGLLVADGVLPPRNAPHRRPREPFVRGVGRAASKAMSPAAL